MTGQRLQKGDIVKLKDAWRPWRVEGMVGVVVGPDGPYMRLHLFVPVRLDESKIPCIVLRTTIDEQYVTIIAHAELPE